MKRLLDRILIRRGWRKAHYYPEQSAPELWRALRAVYNDYLHEQLRAHTELIEQRRRVIQNIRTISTYLDKAQDFDWCRDADDDPEDDIW